MPKRPQQVLIEMPSQTSPHVHWDIFQLVRQELFPHKFYVSIFFSSVLLPQILKFKLTEDNSLIKGALFKFPANATDFSLKPY